MPTPSPQHLRLVKATPKPSTFASKVLRARMEQGLSQRLVEILSGGRVSYRTISRWETGKSIARPGDAIRAYAELTHRPAGWFFFEEEE